MLYFSLSTHQCLMNNFREPIKFMHMYTICILGLKLSIKNLISACIAIYLPDPVLLPAKVDITVDLPTPCIPKQPTTR